MDTIFKLKQHYITPFARMTSTRMLVWYCADFCRWRRSGNTWLSIQCLPRLHLAKMMANYIWFFTSKRFSTMAHILQKQNVSQWGIMLIDLRVNETWYTMSLRGSVLVLKPWITVHIQTLKCDPSQKFCSRHFQIPFAEWIRMNFGLDFIDVCS